MTYTEWAAKYPEAARELNAVVAPEPVPVTPSALSEAWAQQNTRFDLAKQGAMSWRNNVGALLDSRGVPVRFGLANESSAMNEKIKSSDLICAIPRVIGPGDVGRTIAQFGSIECKPPGWEYAGTPHEQAQKAWLVLIESIGGYAKFSTGKVAL